MQSCVSPDKERIANSFHLYSKTISFTRKKELVIIKPIAISLQINMLRNFKILITGAFSDKYDNE
jgi:hypothetical protein